MEGDKIDFQKLDWGSFTKQAYHSGFKKDELMDYAQHVLAHPTRFREITKRRARFYINVIGRKRR